MSAALFVLGVAVWLSVGYAAGVWAMTQERDVTTEDIPFLITFALGGLATVVGILIASTAGSQKRILHRRRAYLTPMPPRPPTPPPPDYPA